MRAISVMKDGSNALRTPDYVTSVILSTASQTITVPSTLGATHVFFASEVGFAAGYGSSVGAGAAAFTTATSSGCELNPTQRFMGKGEIAEIYVIGRSSGYMTASFYNSGST